MTGTTIKNSLLQVFDPTGGQWVAKLGGVILAWLSAFLMPVKGFLFLIGGLVLADLYTGWRKTSKLNGQKFNSAGVGRTLDKTLIYLVLMLVARGVDERYDLEGVLSIAYFVGGLIVGREGLSTFENADAALGTDFAGRITTAFSWLFRKREQDPNTPKP